MRNLAAVLASISTLTIGRPALAQLTSVETESARLVYVAPAESYLVPHVGRALDNALRFQQRMFGFRSSEKVTVLLTDLSDDGNGGATPVPRNVLTIQIAPMDFAYETMLAIERMSFLMNHELVHVAAMDRPAASERFFRGLFAGKVLPVQEHPETMLFGYLTTPRLYAPRWYHEGVATFFDTWMDGGIGRAQGGYDEMVFRSMVRDGSRFYDPLGLASEGAKVQFHVQASSYLYGTRFMSYLAQRHTPEKLIEWIARKPGSKAYFASQFARVFGRPLEDEWRTWIEAERAFQETNLAAIRRHPTTPHTDLSRRALGSVSRAFLDPDGRTLYAAFNYPGTVAHIGAIALDDGRVRKLADIKGPLLYTVTSLAFDPGSRTLFYTTDNAAFRDLVSLDPVTRKQRTLLKDARVGYLAFNPGDRSLWGIRHFNGICTLVRIPHPYREWTRVYSWPYGQVAYDLDVSPDGRQLSVSIADVTGKHSLKVFEVASLLAGEATPAAETDFGTAIPLNFVFAPDGQALYGSSYYTGVSNIFRYEPASGALKAVSNTETGLFRPLPTGGEALIAFRYTGEGFVPTRITAEPLEDVAPIAFFGQRLVDAHPKLKDWAVTGTGALPFNASAARTRRYSLLGNLGLESIYPVAQGYKDFGAAGLRFNFSDPLLLNRASLVASYTPDSDLPSGERLHLQAHYERYDWHGSVRYNAADFYDLVGPTRSSRKGYAVGLGWNKSLVYDQPKTLEFGFDGTFSGNLDQLPEYQNVEVEVDELLSLRARLHYSDVRNSLGYVDDEKGARWEIELGADRVAQQLFPKLRAGVDLGLALPLGHSSLWLRAAAGLSPKDPNQPFANFFFGGFGNNWLDYRDEKRYREHYAFPGLELNEVGGRNFAKSTVEWTLPPLRFRRAGKPGFHLTWARPALFASVLATNLDDDGRRRTLQSAGAQLDLRFSLLSQFDLTLSGGYAVAFEDGRRRNDEVMVSLKLMK